jgi:hypothetical protein
MFFNVKKSILAGVEGYFLFLSILFLAKGISVFIQASEKLQIELTDFIFPLIGFVLLSLIKFLENIRDDVI